MAIFIVWMGKVFHKKRPLAIDERDFDLDFFAVETQTLFTLSRV